MGKVKSYLQLHLNILLFSLTGIFAKMAAIQYDKDVIRVYHIDDFKLCNLCFCLAKGHQEIFFKYSICQSKCLYNLDASVGDSDFSRESFASEHHWYVSGIYGGIGGADV